MSYEKLHYGPIPFLRCRDCGAESFNQRHLQDGHWPHLCKKPAEIPPEVEQESRVEK